MPPINLEKKFALFRDQWSPKVVGELNGQLVKLAKIEGVFVWHSHQDEDELFLVVTGELLMQFRDRTETIREGEFLIVPRGVEHCPLAENECHVLLFEPAQTKHTGDVVSERTVTELQWI
jgi:mannose-6-phosphate isomerase-like protein (cupin superfamily)